MTVWRAMRASDLGAVVALAALVHPEFPERPETFQEKLELFPKGCLALDAGSVLTGYAFSHPWSDGTPALDTLLGKLPARATTLYVHDVALAPAARGCGAARDAISRLAALARELGLPSLSLVAVNGSAPVWRRLGFAPTDEASLDRLGYGTEAIKMRLTV